jgi:hypothetical protein
MPLYPKEFIQTTFLDQYHGIVYTHRYHYIGFVLVCIGIEYLGKCIGPEQDWHKVGLSKQHFRAATSTLMPRYEPHVDLLYSALRSGLAHGLLPGPEIGLTHRAESSRYGTKHLSRHGSSLVLVVEDFYDDFASACKSVIAREFPDGDKMNRALLSVPSDDARRWDTPFPEAKTTAY